MLFTRLRVCILQVPLDMGVRVQSDAGVPIVLSHPDSPPAQAYIRIAGRIKQLLTSTPCSTLAGGQQPSITVE
jgi:MinD-like ATPase involved in chromosome partitioning or flagellar assembly